MLKINIHNVPFYRFSGLGSYYRLAHFVSTRVGGVSEGGQFALNMGFMPADTTTNVLTNRDLLLKELNITYNKTRQSSITNEIVEIVSGANALNG